MFNSKSELAALISSRDGISPNEAWNLIENCQIEIDYIAAKHGNVLEAEDAIMDWLGLEPDYLDLFL